jgi:hypothetical protein
MPVRKSDMYGESKTRPTRFSAASKTLKKSVKRFTETNVTIIGEFPASTAVVQPAVAGRNEQTGHYITLQSRCTVDEAVGLPELQECVHISMQDNSTILVVGDVII